MYPELFEKMRSESSLVPSTTTEVIINPDGSKSTTTRSSKSYRFYYLLLIKIYKIISKGSGNRYFSELE